MYQVAVFHTFISLVDCETCVVSICSVLFGSSHKFAAVFECLLALAVYLSFLTVSSRALSLIATPNCPY